MPSRTGLRMLGAPLKIALSFAGLGFLWMLFWHLTPMPEMVGCFIFALAGPVLVFWMVRNATLQIHTAETATRESEAKYVAFVTNSSEAIWRCELSEPILISSPIEEQVNTFLHKGVLAACNSAMARMYGFEKPEEIVGIRLSDVLDPLDPKNHLFLSAFVESGYQLLDAESVEVDRFGNTKHYLNNMVAWPENGMLSTAWGTQRDVTDQRKVEGEIQRQLRRLTVLRGIDQAILENTGVENSLAEVLAVIAKHLRVEEMRVLVREKGVLREVACRSAGVQFEFDSLEFVRWSVVTSGKFLCLAESEEGAGIVLPLISKGEVLGVVEFLYNEPSEFDDDRRSFYEVLAGQIAIALETATHFENLIRSKKALEDAYDLTLEGWVKALDLRDKETEGHTRRVAEMTTQLAIEMGYPEDQMGNLHRGALLHDIGKIAIPDEILHKPGPLTEEEFKVIQLHPVHAREWLVPIEYLRPALDIPSFHHEKWDGSGYPQGLKGEEIPLAARLFAIVDVYDALTSDRPYRSAMPVQEAVEKIYALSGTHFDPEVVVAFERMLAKQQNLRAA